MHANGAYRDKIAATSTIINNIFSSYRSKTYSSLFSSNFSMSMDSPDSSCGINFKILNNFQFDELSSSKINLQNVRLNSKHYFFFKLFLLKGMKSYTSAFTRNFASLRQQHINKNSQAQLTRLKTDTSSPLCSQLDAHQQILISNKKSKYKLNFGEQFKDLLQPRDQVLEHQFDFAVSFDDQKDLETLRNQQVPNHILEKVRQFLVESASNVTSAAFNFLCKGDLTQEEAKQYASKNILLNINTIFRQTANTLCHYAAQRQQTQKQESDHFETMKQNFAINVDEMMSEILVNLADNYPQAPAAGETPRMREAIIDLNRTQDEENDLILANNLKISSHLKIKRDKNGKQTIQLKQEGDYTKFIMEVINTAINVTQSSEEDYKDRTVKQIFSEFNEKLFCMSQEQSYQNLLNSLQIQRKHENLSSTDQRITEGIVHYFDESLNRKKTSIEAVKSFLDSNIDNMSKKKASLAQFLDPASDIKKDQRASYVSSQPISMFSDINAKEKLEKFREKGQKGSKTYGIGQKIPSLVKQFTKQEMDNALFTSKHSSILRILTKWAEYLQQIFQNPQKSILQRMYPFKTIQNQLVILNHKSDGDEKLIEQLHYQYQEVKKKSESIARSCYSFMSQFLTKSEQFQSSVERYAETRDVASKINAVLASLMLKYTNTLIHHLIKAGQHIGTDHLIKNINLVVFRVSDLLRAKLQCNESSFISLLKTMYILDNSETMKDKFKLVRIKNKLDDPANNIMINYLFMGKVQCQLQLSIQQPKGKARNYYTFSHFIYELTRGKFGAIAECATMISQLDPMINACKGSYYKEKKGRKICNISLTSKSVGVQSSSNDFENNIKSSIFQCMDQKCKRLVINESRQIFSKTNQSICNRCIINNEEPQKQINDECLRSHISDNASLKRINNFSPLNELKQRIDQCAYDCLAILNDRGKLTFNLAIYNREEFKTFLLRLNSTVIQQIGTPDFNFDSLDYTDITKTIKEDEKHTQHSKQLIYVINDVPSCSQELFLLMKMDKNKVMEKLVYIVKEFEEFRLEKNMISSIKFKTGIITTNFNLERWNRLGKIVTAFQQQDQSQTALRYKKYKNADFSSIKQVYARHMGLTQIPEWLIQLKNLRTLEMDENKLLKISKGQLPSSLTHLVITDNKLSQMSLSNLQSLDYLSLSKNQLSSIDISNLSCLKELRLIDNKLQQIVLKDSQLVDDRMVERTPQNLKYASLQNNYLRQIDLSMLRHLVKVNLSKNKLETINLNNLSNLQQLRLCDNQLTHIDLSSLVSLTYLDLTKNSLENIDLQNLTNLSEAYLWCNKLATINVTNQKKLFKLSIRSNPSIVILDSLPVSLIFLAADRSTVLHYDFKELKTLKELTIRNGKTERQELMNLGEQVTLASEDS